MNLGLMCRVVLKIVRWPVMMNFHVGEVFVLVSFGFECEFVGPIEVSGNDGTFHLKYSHFHSAKRKLLSHDDASHLEYRFWTFL